MNPSVVPRKHAGYRYEMLDGEFMLYSSERTQAVYLNESASAIWGLIDGRRSVEEIAELLAGAFEVPLAEMRADVMEALKRMAEDGVVELR